MGGMCKCPHHVVVKILYVLVWISAIGFWWAGWHGGWAWGMDQNYFFENIVVLMLLSFGSKFCGCCGWHGKMMMGTGDKMDGGMCKHGMDCKCNDCDRCK